MICRSVQRVLLGNDLNQNLSELLDPSTVTTLIIQYIFYRGFGVISLTNETRLGYENMVSIALISTPHPRGFRKTCTRHFTVGVKLLPPPVILEPFLRQMKLKVSKYGFSSINIYGPPWFHGDLLDRSN